MEPLAKAPRPQRWLASPLAVAGFVVAAALAAFTPNAVQAWQKDVSPWDRELSQAVHAYENRDTFLNSHVDVLGLVLRPALQAVAFALVLGVAIALARRGQRKSALMLLATVAGASLLAAVLKEVIDRPPVDAGSRRVGGDGGDPTGDAFPSGHAVRSMAAAASLAVVAWPTRFRWWVAAAGALAVTLVGVGVVYHEWHWASDVVGGWALAVAWLGCVWLALHPRTMQALGRRETGLTRS